MRFFGLIFGLVLLFTACNRGSEKEKGESVPELATGKYKVSAFGSCDTVKNSGVYAKIDLWLPADSVPAADKVNALLKSRIIERINSFADSASIAANPSAAESIDGAFKVFETNYRNFKKTSPDAPGCWSIELKGDTTMATSRLLCYQLDQFSFTGGAHPNSFRSFHIFDAKTGSEVPVKQFVTDSVALTRLVEQEFRKVEKLPADADLEKAGYFLVNHTFVLPVSYTFTREGMLFYYNPYEIAAYARGSIHFVIPYAKLEKMVKTDQIF